MDEQPIVVGDTLYWLLIAYKDGEIWNLAGATITHTFYSPYMVKKQETMTILSAADGTAYKVNDASIFDYPGDWKHSYKVVIGSTVLESEEEEFYVHRALSAV